MRQLLQVVQMGQTASGVWLQRPGDVKSRERCEGASLLALKMEEAARNQGMKEMLTRSLKNWEMESPPESPEGSNPLLA